MVKLIFDIIFEIFGWWQPEKKKNHSMYTFFEIFIELREAKILRRLSPYFVNCNLQLSKYSFDLNEFLFRKDEMVQT